MSTLNANLEQAQSYIARFREEGVMNHVEDGQIMVGSPALPERDYWRIAVVWRKLPNLQQQWKKLAKQIQTLTTSGREAA